LHGQAFNAFKILESGYIVHPPFLELTLLQPCSVMIKLFLAFSYRQELTELLRVLGVINFFGNHIGIWRTRQVRCMLIWKARRGIERIDGRATRCTCQIGAIDMEQNSEKHLRISRTK
jgi:hypothetical protein